MEVGGNFVIQRLGGNSEHIQLVVFVATHCYGIFHTNIPGKLAADVLTNAGPMGERIVHSSNSCRERSQVTSNPS